MAEFVRAVRTGDAIEARRIDASLTPLWDTFKAHGSVRVMYVLLEMLGIATVAPPLPIQPLGPAARERVADALAGLRGRS